MRSESKNVVISGREKFPSTAFAEFQRTSISEKSEKFSDKNRFESMEKASVRSRSRF